MLLLHVAVCIIGWTWVRQTPRVVQDGSLASKRLHWSTSILKKYWIFSTIGLGFSTSALFFPNHKGELNFLSELFVSSLYVCWIAATLVLPVGDDSARATRRLVLDTLLIFATILTVGWLGCADSVSALLRNGEKRLILVPWFIAGDFMLIAAFFSFLLRTQNPKVTRDVRIYGCIVFVLTVVDLQGVLSVQNGLAQSYSVNSTGWTVAHLLACAYPTRLVENLQSQSAQPSGLSRFQQAFEQALPLVAVPITLGSLAFTIYFQQTKLIVVGTGLGAILALLMATLRAHFLYRENLELQRELNQTIEGVGAQVNIKTTALQDTLSVLQERDNFLESVFKSIPGAIFQCEVMDQQIVRLGFMSEGIKDLWGLEPSELKASFRPLIRQVVREHRANVISEMKTVMSGGEDWLLEFDIIDQNGARRSIRSTARCEGYSERVSTWTGLFLDITAEKSHQKQLAENEKRIRDLTSAIPGAVFYYRVDADGNRSLPYVSDGITELFGISAEQAMKDPNLISAAVVPEDRLRIQQEFKESARTGNPMITHARVIHPTRGLLWTSASSISRKLDDGSMVWTGIYSDITDLKHVEEQLQSQKQFLRQVINANPNLIVVRSYDGKFDLANEQAARVYGKTVEELEASAPQYRATDSAHAQRILEQDRDIIDSGETVFIPERTIKYFDGEEVTMQIVKSRLPGNSAQGDRLLLVGTDITERVRTANELKVARNLAEAAAEAKSEFLANMSHEIRTPMNGVLGMMEILLETELNEDQRDCADIIHRSAKSLLNIINDILEISKLDSGKLDLSQVPFSVHELTEEITTLHLANARKNGVDITTEIDLPDRVGFLGDSHRIGQILHNLVSNAVKFTPAGKITVRACQDGESKQLLLCVKDTGIGMSEESQAKIFETFTQADNSITKKYGGTGLGLSIAKRLVELMRGSLYVSSELGKGTSFTVQLPLEAIELEARTVETPIGAIQPSSQQFDILLVEDNAVNQKVAVRMIEGFGHRVSVVEDGVAALQALQNRSYDLVFMDCMMPVMDGLEATRRIRFEEKRTGDHQPIVAMTANALSGDEALCLEAGMDSYLAKPFQRTEVNLAIEKWARRLPRSQAA